MSFLNFGNSGGESTKTSKHKNRDAIETIGLSLIITLFLLGWAYGKQEDQDLEIVTVEAIPIETTVSDPVIEVEVKEIVKEPEIERVSLGEYRITAYCACEVCCPGTSDGITATGTKATEGRTIAVDPDVIPLGSIVEINGVEYVAEDVGGAIKGDRIDLYFNSHEDALEWGVQYLDIFLIEFTQFRK